jgi:polyphosphate:AMP phosphotransferase
VDDNDRCAGARADEQECRMFESAQQIHKIDKPTFKREETELREALLEAQFDLTEKKTFPVLILLSGIDGAGKGAALSRLYEWLDPHHLRTQAFDRPNDEERARPRMWRYWRDLPPKGEIGVYIGSWYREPFAARVLGADDDDAFASNMAAINRFEEMLTHEGTLLLKLWLHLSRGQRKERRRQMTDGAGARHVLEHAGWNRKYPEVMAVVQTMARLTSTGHAPWVVIPSSDPEYRDLMIGRTLLETLRERLDQNAPLVSRPSPAIIPSIDRKTILDDIDLSRKIEITEYKQALTKHQQRLAELTDGKVFRRIGVVVAFEGNDAAGKGGSIRRVTAALDPRRFRINPIAAPTDEERAQPYLWRFWRRVPGKGHIAIFDRSWYGRVLVERVEGFCSESDWMRAYGEINDFEAELRAAGIIVVKFWLAISQDEQLKRFKERENTPFRRYKITPEDWRNREKWAAYAQAASDMIDRTSTEYAPWAIVEAEDKNFARVKILKTFCERIAAAL